MKQFLNIFLAVCLLALNACSNPADRRICFFGSSVCRGVGADSLHGYAWQYSKLLPKSWSIVNLSVDGNDTYDLLARFDTDLLPDDSRFVVIGLSLGNEGLHESGEAAVLSYKENLQTLARKIRELGRIPVVAGSYVRADFNPVDYEDLLSVNLEMMQWDLPTIAFLGALDDGCGRWADCCWNHEDKWHPNTYGHTLLCSAIPPSLFQALAQGKPLPYRSKALNRLKSDGLNGSASFIPEAGLHSYTLSYKCADTVYTKVHSSARNLTWYYVNGECQTETDDNLVPASFTIEGNALCDLFFFRTPLSPREVKALADGAMLRSSLEIYAPLTGDSPAENLAQTLNTITINPYY